MWIAYFKRGITSFEGVFTIQRSENGQVVEKPIDRVRARSGGASYFNREWIRGKSPIPRGDFNLWLKPNNKGAKAGATGIGEFYPICNKGDRYTIIETPCPAGQKPRIREEIGLHDENAIPGSAGCIVIVYESDFWRVSKLLQEIGKTQESILLKAF